MTTRVIDIGNKKIEIDKKGVGQPIIVIETGCGSLLYDWKDIAEELSKTATVLRYHRAGYGKSTYDSEGKRSSSNIIEDLHKVLDKEGIDDKVILVGHSLGGLCVHHFARKYPNRVKGLVLVDASFIDYQKIEDLKSRLPVINEKYKLNDMIAKWKNLSKKTQGELTEELKPKLTDKQKELPQEVQNNILNTMTDPNLYGTIASECEYLCENGKEVLASGEFPNIPLKVIVRDEEVEINKLIKVDVPKEEAEKLEDLVQKLGREHVNLSEKSELIIAKGCSHSIHLDNPKLVIDSVKKLIEESFYQ